MKKEKNKMVSMRKQEKQALKELKKSRQIMPENTDDMEETESGDFGSNLKERLNYLRNGTVKEDGREEKIDITSKEDEVLMEHPLPTTLAIDLIPIEKIINGTIHTEDNRCLKIIEIMPINFLLKSDEDQEEVVYEFEKFLRIAPDNMQIKSLSKRTDISRYLQKIEENIENETDIRCKKLLQDERNLIYNIGALESVSRRFFLTFEVRKRIGCSEEEIENELNILKDRAINYLRQCGNNVLIMENNTEETARILFDILNRTRNASVDFPKRVSEVYGYYDMNYGAKATKMIPVTEYFTPKKIVLKHGNYTKMDDTYYTYLFVKSDSYPAEILKGWTAIMINAGEGIDVDFFIKKQDRIKSITRIGRHLRWNNSKIKDMNNTTTDFDNMEDTISSGYYLKNGLAANQDLYYMGVLITITSDSLKNLMSKREEMITYLKTYEISVGNCDYEQKRAFLSYLPLCNMDKKIFRRTKRNILTRDLAASYPFTSYEMCDENGILLGINELNNSLCITDFFNTAVYKNANISIMGTTGAGKTYLLQLIAMRFRKKQIQTFIIAPDKGHEFKRACDNIGGEFIKISPASNQCINVLEIRKKDDSANKALDGEIEQSELALKIQSLHIFFSLLIPGLTAEEDQILDEAMIQAYRKKGISHENGSLFEPGNPEKYREMPILGDVYEELLKRADAKRIAIIFNRLVNGSAKSFNQQTNVNTENLYTVIDISSLTGDLLTVGMFIALDFVYSKAKENRTKKKAIIIDEIWELIGSKSNTKAAEYALEIFKIIRGYGGSAICATQDLNDFFALEDGKYGKGIINNSKTKIVLNLENKEAKAVQELLTLSDEEYKKIIRFERGHGLLSTNGNNIPIHFKSSQLENALITTDRAELDVLVKSRFFSV